LAVAVRVSGVDIKQRERAKRRECLSRDKIAVVFRPCPSCYALKPHLDVVTSSWDIPSPTYVHLKKKKKKTCTDRLFPKMGECREVLGGGPAPPSKL